MKTAVGKFTFTVPEGHPDGGTKVEKPYEYTVCESESEAQSELTKRKLNFVEIVNDKLKTNARGNAYQAALLPYKPSEVAPEDIEERMVRDMIRRGKSEAYARRAVAAMLAGDEDDFAGADTPASTVPAEEPEEL